MSIFIYIFLAYVLIINLLGFTSMGVDKYKARKHLWRIPEKVLFTIAILGGSIGSSLGMYTFRHKTKHKSFVIGIPTIIVIHFILIIVFLLYFYKQKFTIQTKSKVFPITTKPKDINAFGLCYLYIVICVIFLLLTQVQSQVHLTAYHLLHLELPSLNKMHPLLQGMRLHL